MRLAIFQADYFVHLHLFLWPQEVKYEGKTSELQENSMLTSNFVYTSMETFVGVNY